MRRGGWTVGAACALAAVGLGVLVAGERQPPTNPAGEAKAPATAGGSDRAADREGIRKAGAEFAAAFERGDAKAVAALWTDAAEYVEEDGTRIEGRAAIEKAFAELFRDGHRAKLEIDARSVRFPARDTAIEEGILRHTPDGPGLPSSTRYETVHVREDGKWLMARSREWAPEDRLGDLAFLIGQWTGGPKGEEVTLSFAKDPDGPFINGRFTRQVKGRPGPTGTIRIGLDAERGQLRSWHFEADGGQGQCLWVRDGDKWVLDAVGVAGDGTATAAVNLLTRSGPDEIVWRSVDRLAGGDAVPDTAPVKLTRVKDAR